MNEYKKIGDLAGYVRQMMENGAETVIGEKTARIAARPGEPGETVISWSEDSSGNPIVEKEAAVSLNEAGKPDWIATKIDEAGNEIKDAHGHTNCWIIDDQTFQRKYVPVPGIPGRFMPAGGPQKFLCLTEAIHILQWGEEWNVDAGG